MARRVFISFQHDDVRKAHGFNLLRWNKNVDFMFVGRHLLSPVDSEDAAYVRRKIGEQLDGTSVTVVLIGRKTCDSDWVAEEIRRSDQRGNGLLGIRLADGCDSPKALLEAGAEIIDWNPHEFSAAIERAARAAGRARAIRAAKDREHHACSRTVSVR